MSWHGGTPLAELCGRDGSFRHGSEPVALMDPESNQPLYPVPPSRAHHPDQLGQHEFVQVPVYLEEPRVPRPRGKKSDPDKTVLLVLASGLAVALIAVLGLAILYCRRADRESSRPSAVIYHVYGGSVGGYGSAPFHPGSALFLPSGPR